MTGEEKEMIEKMYEKIDYTIMSMIPEDRWKEMIKYRVEEFFRRRENGCFGSHYTENCLDRIITNKLNETALSIFKEVIDEFRKSHYQEAKDKTAGILKEFLLENSNQILSNYLESIFRCHLDEFSSRRL